MDFKAAALQVFVPVLCALFTALAGYGVAWLRKRAEEANLGVWKDAAEIVFDELDTAITKFQPLVDEMKAKAKDGKLDSDQIAALQAKAIDFVQTQLKPQGINVLKTVGAEMLSGWVTHLVEMRKNPALVANVNTLARPPRQLV
jgi:hypothetical protein